MFHETVCPMSQCVVVTGAASGIGLAIAKRLAGAGWAVVGVDVDGDKLAEEFEKLEGSGHLTTVGSVADVAVHEAAAQAADSGGQLAGWVNCAGITQATPLDDPDPAVLRQLLEVNQLGAFWGTSQAVRKFIANGRGGAIVNVSSIHARLAYPDFAGYEMTKAAVEALTRSTAVTYGSLGIRANAVAPGPVRTPALETTAAEMDGDHIATLERQIPLGRIAESDEIAKATEFLLSSEASFVTGQTLVVDGGWSAAMIEPGDKARASGPVTR